MYLHIWDCSDLFSRVCREMKTFNPLKTKVFWVALLWADHSWGSEEPVIKASPPTSSSWHFWANFSSISSHDSWHFLSGRAFYRSCLLTNFLLTCINVHFYGKWNPILSHFLQFLNKYFVIIFPEYIHEFISHFHCLPSRLWLNYLWNISKYS